jgi:hypothetical protein
MIVSERPVNRFLKLDSTAHGNGGLSQNFDSWLMPDYIGLSVVPFDWSLPRTWAQDPLIWFLFVCHSFGLLPPRCYTRQGLKTNICHPRAAEFVSKFFNKKGHILKLIFEFLHIDENILILFYNLTVGVIKIISSPKKCSKLC